MSVNSIARATLAALVVSSAEGSLPPFDSFVQLHGRTYRKDSAEYAERRSLYEQRSAVAEQQNSDPQRMWVAGVNKLWDWTDSELKTLRGWDGSAMPEAGSSRAIRAHGAFLQQKEELPAEKMWMDLYTTKHVKNQGDCGSCWAIAAATVLEAHYEIHAGKPRSFSAQQIVACTPNPKQCGGDGGCKGATAELAMDWVLKHGCAEESQIPYEAHDSQCTETAPALMMSQLMSNDDGAPGASGGAAFGMTGWETLPKNEYEPLARALVERGPVAVSVAADSWFSYESGVFNGCPKDAIIDHAVTAVGFGKDNSVKYWEIQNSWGDDWGEKGHIRIQRHDEDTYCGINNKPELGVACKGDTAPVPVCGMCGILFDSVVPHFG
jgi:cathepsin L